jgi:hypothetical protein
VRTPLCALLSCALAVAPLSAGADSTDVNSERKIAVLPLKVEGPADETTRRAWTEGLRRGIGRGDFTLAEQKAVDASADAACDRKSCWDKLRGATSATHMVRTQVTIKNRDYALKLELVDAESGAVIVSTEDRCEICGVEEVTNLLDSQGALLQTRLAAMGKGPPVLVVDTKPSGALVFVDDEVVGTTPLERPVLEGAHKVRISLSGYVAEERELSLVPGVREQVNIELQRTPGSPKRRALGAAALGGGLALLGAGLTLVALDDKPFPGDCPGTSGDRLKDCVSLYNTGLGGTVAAVVGAALTTLGIVVLVRNRNVKPARQAWVVPAGLGVVGRF